MSDNRRFIRFACISGIDRKELPIAAEVWLESIAQSAWADRNILKLSTLFMKYMREPNPSMLRFGYIGQVVGLDNRGLDASMRLMVVYGAVETYDCSGEALRASLNLSYLQRLKVLEIARRFRELQHFDSTGSMPWHQRNENWLPHTVAIDDADTETLEKQDFNNDRDVLVSRIRSSPPFCDDHLSERRSTEGL